MRIRERVEAFKAGTGPYAGPTGEWATPERTAELERQARAEIRVQIAEEKRLRRERKELLFAHRAASKRLTLAAKSLPYVYGPPPGTEAVKAAVRRAKALCREMAPLQALEASVTDCELVDVVEAVLAMRGSGL